MEREDCLDEGKVSLLKNWEANKGNNQERIKKLIKKHYNSKRGVAVTECSINGCHIFLVI